ncbi:unnamed protein product [Albugo candida]|uniref:Uncharacterized protein n=1 Tax=Albugo candida TaxID=65357 RepID=A0A024GUJ8_9STRA|nr:unnamed protein product [Albugo candida]|eukprot:CCI50649.1 unnamed protein product [Albugo candida]
MTVCYVITKDSIETESSLDFFRSSQATVYFDSESFPLMHQAIKKSNIRMQIGKHKTEKHKDATDHFSTEELWSIHRRSGNELDIMPMILDLVLLFVKDKSCHANKNLIHHSLAAPAISHIPYSSSECFCACSLYFIETRAVEPIIHDIPKKFAALANIHFASSIVGNPRIGVLSYVKHYFSYQSRTSVVYVIYSSELKDFVELCIKTKICHGTTALLSDDLCNLFKYQISAKAKQSRKMPQLTGTILDNIRLFTTINQVAARKKEIKTNLQPLTFHSFPMSVINWSISWEKASLLEMLGQSL